MDNVVNKQVEIKERLNAKEDVFKDMSANQKREYISKHYRPVGEHKQIEVGYGKALIKRVTFGYPMAGIVNDTPFKGVGNQLEFIAGINTDGTNVKELYKIGDIISISSGALTADNKIFFLDEPLDYFNIKQLLDSLEFKEKRDLKPFNTVDLVEYFVVELYQIQCKLKY